MHEHRRFDDEAATWDDDPGHEARQVAVARTIEQALDLDFLISFSGVVTFRSAVALQLVAQRIAHDRYLIETDSPYLAPVPFRGKPNYPHYVRQVAEAVAKLRNVELGEVEDDSSANYRRLFRIPG